MVDPETMTAEERAEALLEDEIMKAWSGLLHQQAGRLILWTILDKCGQFNFDCIGGEADILNRGRQQIGGELLRDFVFPHGMGPYTDMLLEAEKRDERLILAAKLTEKNNEKEE